MMQLVLWTCIQSTDFYYAWMGHPRIVTITICDDQRFWLFDSALPGSLTENVVSTTTHSPKLREDWSPAPASGGEEERVGALHAAPCQLQDPQALVVAQGSQ